MFPPRSMALGDVLCEGEMGLGNAFWLLLEIHNVVSIAKATMSQPSQAKTYEPRRHSLSVQSPPESVSLPCVAHGPSLFAYSFLHLSLGLTWDLVHHRCSANGLWLKLSGIYRNSRTVSSPDP
jgi:hypothetical protein